MNFLKSVREEMGKVTWPSGRELASDVRDVLETLVIFSVFFYVVDTISQLLLGWIVNR